MQNIYTCLDKKRKTALIIGAVAAGTAAVIGAAWLASKYSKQKTENPSDIW